MERNSFGGLKSECAPPTNIVCYLIRRNLDLGSVGKQKLRYFFVVKVQRRLESAAEISTPEVDISSVDEQELHYIFKPFIQSRLESAAVLPAWRLASAPLAST